MGITDAVGEV